MFAMDFENLEQMFLRSPKAAKEENATTFPTWPTETMADTEELFDLKELTLPEASSSLSSNSTLNTSDVEALGPVSWPAIGVVSHQI